MEVDICLAHLLLWVETSRNDRWRIHRWFSSISYLSSTSTRICYGDIVKLVDDGGTTTVHKDTGTTSATPIGIFLGCRYIDVSTSQLTFSQQWSGAAHTSGMAYVADDPNILFAVQADGTVNDDDLGANVALVQPTSSSTFGMSRAGIDISTTATTASLPVRIVDFLGGHDGDEKEHHFLSCFVSLIQDIC